MRKESEKIPPNEHELVLAKLQDLLELYDSLILSDHYLDFQETHKTLFVIRLLNHKKYLLLLDDLQNDVCVTVYYPINLSHPKGPYYRVINTNKKGYDDINMFKEDVQVFIKQLSDQVSMMIHQVFIP